MPLPSVSALSGVKSLASKQNLSPLLEYCDICLCAMIDRPLKCNIFPFNFFLLPLFFLSAIMFIGSFQVTLPPLKAELERRPVYFYRTKTQCAQRLKQYCDKEALLKRKESESMGLLLFVICKPQ
jgi:hypothetical protein